MVRGAPFDRLGEEARGKLGGALLQGHGVEPHGQGDAVEVQQGLNLRQGILMEKLNPEVINFILNILTFFLYMTIIFGLIFLFYLFSCYL